MPEQAPSAAQHLYAQAVQHHEAGRLDDAVICYRNVILAEPTNLDAHSNLGVALQKQGWLTEAVICLRTALDLRLQQDPSRHLSFALRQKYRLDDAAACHQEAINHYSAGRYSEA